MGANRFATMLQRRTNRITVILVYALLEWVLILLLFMSSLISHMIIKFVMFFGLKPPCPSCTRIDRIFDSENGYISFLCKVHAKEVSRFGFCLIHSKLAVFQDMCHDCLFSMPDFDSFSRIRFTINDELAGGNSDLVSEEENHGFVSIDSDKNASEFEVEKCDEHSKVNQYGTLKAFSICHLPSVDAEESCAGMRLDDHTDIEESEEAEADVSIGTEIPDLHTSDELQIKDDNLSELESVNRIEYNSSIQLEKREQYSWAEESFDGSVTSYDGVVTIESLKSALKAERKALKILYAEFEEERNASCVATSQTMAMINRLQEEKACMQMEGLQYQRMMEEQYEYDQDALQVMNELMVKRENEKRELEMALEECMKLKRR